MNIVLTGYSGFIGNYFLKYLSKNNSNNIFLLGRKKISNYKFAYWDLDKKNVSESLFHNIDILFHFASIAHTSENKINSFYNKIFNHNYKATIYLANLSVKFNLKKFVFISSTKALDPDFINLDIKQLKKLKTKNIYGKIKRITELELQNIFINSKTKLFLIRPSLVYGPNVKGNLNSLKNYIYKSPIVILPAFKNKRNLIHIDNLIYSIDFIVFKKKLDFVEYTFADDNIYSFFEISKAINLLYKKRIFYVTIPNFLLKFLLYMNIFFKNNLINKIFSDDVYLTTNLKQYEFNQVRKIENFYETDF